VKVSFIIMTLNRPDLVRGFYESVRAGNAVEDWELVVVDGSPDDAETRALVADLPNARHILFPQRPFNFFRGLNAGATQATGDVLAFCNNDIIFLSHGFVAGVHQLLQQNPAIGCVTTAHEVGSHRIRQTDLTPFSVPPNCGLANDVNCWVYGAAYFLPRWTYEVIGRFEEAFTGAWYEEAWVARQILLAGQRVAWVSIELFHYNSATPNDAFRSPENVNRNIEIMERVSGVFNPFRLAGTSASFPNNMGSGTCYATLAISPAAWDSVTWNLDISRGGVPKPNGFLRLSEQPGPETDLVWHPPHGIPWPDSVVRNILAANTFSRLEHRLELFNECWRVLRPGGFLILQWLFGDECRLARTFWDFWGAGERGMSQRPFDVASLSVQRFQDDQGVLRALLRAIK